jgi:hypothetical protein
MATKKKAKAKKPRKAAKSTKAAAPKRPAKLRHKKAKRLTRVELLAQQVKSLQKRLRKYERQRFVGPLLPGKKRKRPSRTEVEAHRLALKSFFEGVKRNLEAASIAAKYRSHENADGSIDGEIRIPLEDSGDVEGHLVDVEDAGDWNSLGEYWVMMGLNTSSENETGSPTIDRRPNRAWTNPVRANRSGAAFFTLSNTVVKKLEEWGSDFTMIVIRLFWSPDNERMKRPGQH